MPAELDDLPRLMQQIGNDLPNQSFAKSFEEIDKDLRAQASEQFQSGKDPNGNPWAPLKPSTIRRKGHGIILIEHEDLMDSLVDETGDSIRRTEPHSLEWGTKDFKAVFHQEGSSRMPARPPVGMSKETLDAAVEHVADNALENVLASVDQFLHSVR